ncbi:MAG: uracil-DNA glycosylase [Candidatus Thermoplasmatota archaeon]|nr:uracil-DNA glycosylase [Candidatus Thermoplasmatota archaeon]MCL5880961.1 uracil-DNA glycosylase [Candidatus Thermoplasmatota archaeon]
MPIGQEDTESPCIDLGNRIISCKKCPRLVLYRQSVSISAKRYPGQEFWRKPVPGYGDVKGRLLIVGMAPAASGGNRTGRVFTGDKSAQFLVSALFKSGFCNQPTSEARDDGLRYLDAYVTAAVKCVPPDNKPTLAELDNCLPYLKEEISCMPNLKAILVLGRFAFESIVRIFCSMGYNVSRSSFQNRSFLDVGNVRIFMSFHPSPRNVNTGKLSEDSFMQTLLGIREYLKKTQ